MVTRRQVIILPQDTAPVIEDTSIQGNNEVQTWVGLSVVRLAAIAVATSAQRLVQLSDNNLDALESPASKLLARWLTNGNRSSLLGA
jgi:hypothetical protein